MGLSAAAAGAVAARLPLEGLFALGVALVGAAALLQPAFGLALALILGPLQPLERIVLGFGLGSGQVVLGVALLAYWLRTLAHRQLNVHTWGTPVMLPLVIFIGVAFISFFVAQDAGEWLSELIKWLQFALVALIVANASEKERGVIIGAVLLSGAIQAAAGFYQAVLRGTGRQSFSSSAAQRVTVLTARLSSLTLLAASWG